MVELEDVDPVRRVAGKAILDLTDQFGFEAFAAAWLHDRTTGTWKYLLVTPMLKSKGPHWVYDRLIKLFRHYPLPDGISPLDVHVIDPAMEVAAFGPPLMALDDRDAPTGLVMFLATDTLIGDLFVDEGFAAFYRRLPASSRTRRGDIARRFDHRVRQLDLAA